MRGRAIALLLLLGLAALGAPSNAETVEDIYDEVADESAFLVVRRKLSEEKPQVGKEISVTVEIHNVGKAPANDVTAVDVAWDAETFRTEGKVDASFTSIAAGATKAYSYTITPKIAVELYEQRPVLITYVAGKDAAPITTHSHPLYFRSFSSGDVMKMKALEIGSSLTLGMFRTEKDWIRFVAVTGGGFVVYVLLGAHRAFSKARADSRRKKALRDLGVAEDFKTK